MSIGDELLKLEALKRSGTLNEAEFQTAKSQILQGNVRMECQDCKQHFSPDQLKDTKISKTSVGFTPGGAVPVMSEETIKICENCAKVRISNNQVTSLITWIIAFILIGVFAFLIIRKLSQ